jgi:hypothetical protein
VRRPSQGSARIPRIGDLGRECNGFVEFGASEIAPLQRNVADSTRAEEIRASGVVFGFAESSAVLGECEFGAVGGEQCVPTQLPLTLQQRQQWSACASTAQAQAHAQALHTYRNAACELVRDD